MQVQLDQLFKAANHAIEPQPSFRQTFTHDDGDALESGPQGRLILGTFRLGKAHQPSSEEAVHSVSS